MRRNLWDIAVSIFVVALVYILVRPSSKGADMVAAVGGALVAIVSNAADLAAPGGPPKPPPDQFGN
jgi:Na+/H+ antiporter NhaD/arsenite permease-like protein